VNRSILRIASVVFALGGVSGCAAIQDSQVLQPEFWNFTANGGPAQNNEAELGIAELAKGDSVRALGHFEKALKANPNDVHALFGMAMMYQNTGQPSRARLFYEPILTMRPAPMDEILIWADKQTYPIVDVAQVNLQLLQNGGMAGGPGTPMGQMASPSAAPMMQQPGVQQGLAQPQSQLYMQPKLSPQAPVAAEPMFQNADLNIVARFKAMRALLNEGLITEDEFVRRRQVNLGALLPMTAPPAATGMDRPVPAVDQISGRLRAISRALEMRALSPAQHTAERTMILDALMPAQPAAVSNPAPPPQGLMEAADAVRRLEMLKTADIITSDEYTKERAAIERSMQPAAPPPMAGSAEPKEKSSANSPQISGFQPAVHLASFRQHGAAVRGWCGVEHTASPDCRACSPGSSGWAWARPKACSIV